MSGLRTALAHINTPHPTHFHPGLAHLAPQATPPGILDISPTRVNADIHHLPAAFKSSPEQLARADHPQHLTAKLNLNTNWPSLAKNIKAAQLSEDSFLLPYDPQTALEILPGVRPVQLLNKAAVATGIPARELRDELVTNLALLPLGFVGNIKNVGKTLERIVESARRPNTSRPLELVPQAAHKVLPVNQVRNMPLDALAQRFNDMRKYALEIVDSTTLSSKQKVGVLKARISEEQELLRGSLKIDGDRLEALGDSNQTLKVLAHELEVRQSYHAQLVDLLTHHLERIPQFATK